MDIARGKSCGQGVAHRVVVSRLEAGCNRSRSSGFRVMDHRRKHRHSQRQSFYEWRDPNLRRLMNIYSSPASQLQADLGEQNGETCHQLMQRLSSGIADDTMSAADAASILSQLDASGDLPCVDADTWSGIAQRAVLDAADLSPGDVTALARSFARAEAEAPADLLAALSKKVVTKPRKFAPQQLGTITWAFTSLKKPCSDLFFTVMVQLEGQPEAFGAKGFADAVWALGVTGWLTADLLRKIRPALQDLAPLMTPEELQRLFDGVQAVPGGTQALGLGSTPPSENKQP